MLQKSLPQNSKNTHWKHNIDKSYPKSPLHISSNLLLCQLRRKVNLINKLTIHKLNKSVRKDKHTVVFDPIFKYTLVAKKEMLS